MGPACGATGIVLASAGGGVHPLVRDIGLTLLVAGLLSVVAARTRFPTIAALLAAGILLGPECAQVVTDAENIRAIAGLGLVLLLFLIGLEMDFHKLLQSGRPLIVAGLLQFPLCLAFGWAATAALRATGWGPAQGEWVPVYAGIAAAASSTLVIVKLLQERGQMDTVVGRLAVGVLVFQDLWAIVVLAVQPRFLHPDVAPILWTFGGILILAAVSTLLARFALPTVFRWIASMPELMLGAALAWCFGIGFLGLHLGDLFEAAGVHAPVAVSLEMGALLAGASIASFPYAAHLVSKVGVVHDFFITLFFVALGMQIPRPDGAGVLLLAGCLAAWAALSRYAVLFPLLYWTGMDRRSAVVASTKLIPISEFCLVIAYLGMLLGHIPKGVVSAVIFAFVLTALASPIVFGAGERIHRALGGLLGALGFRAPDAAATTEDRGEAPEIVVLGVHRVASSLLHDIEKRRPDLRAKTLVIDFNVALHRDLAARGFRVLYGDFSQPGTLYHARVAEAKVVLSTIPDDMLRDTSNLRLVRLLREVSPDPVLIVNSVTTAGVRELYSAGADFVFLPRVETALALMPTLEAALSGSMDRHRRERIESLGPVEERREVLP